MVPGSFVAQLAALIYACLTILWAWNRPQGAWHGDTGWKAAWAISGVAAFLLAAVVIYALRRDGRGARSSLNTHRTCQKFVHVAIDHGLPAAAVGAHVWMKRGVWGAQYLRRVSRVERPSFGEPIGIMWRKGKGVLGMCWQRRKPMVVDLEQLRALAPTRQAFEAIDPQFVADEIPTRFGLTWEEFEQTARYQAVLVIPLTNFDKWPRPRVVGFVTVDVFAPGFAGQLDELNSIGAFRGVTTMFQSGFNSVDEE